MIEKILCGDFLKMPIVEALEQIKIVRSDKYCLKIADEKGFIGSIYIMTDEALSNRVSEAYEHDYKGELFKLISVIHPDGLSHMHKFGINKAIDDCTLLVIKRRQETEQRKGRLFDSGALNKLIGLLERGYKPNNSIELVKGDNVFKIDSDGFVFSVID